MTRDAHEHTKKVKLDIVSKPTLFERVKNNVYTPLYH